MNDSDEVNGTAVIQLGRYDSEFVDQYALLPWNNRVSFAMTKSHGPLILTFDESMHERASLIKQGFS